MADVIGSMDVASFLKRLKLPDRYEQYFSEKGLFTVEDCKYLDEDVLKTMGITMPGHYKRILKNLPGCAVKKQSDILKMDLLAPDSVFSSESTRSLSPGLQYLQANHEQVSTARIKENMSRRKIDEEMGMSEENCIYDVPGFPIRRSTVKPSTGFTFDESLPENPYETSVVHLPSPLPPPPLDDDELDSIEAKSLPPPPSPDAYGERNSIAEEDPYMCETSNKVIDIPPDSYSDDRDLFFPSPTKTRHFSENSSDYNDPSSIYNIPLPPREFFQPIVEFSKASFDEDDYDHLSNNKKPSSQPQSPGFIGNAVANIFSQNPRGDRSGTLSSNGNEEDIYDRLGSDPLSRRSTLPKDCAPTLLTPPLGSPRSRKSSAANGSDDDYIRPRSESPYSMSSEIEKTPSAKNMPLPQRPWEAVIGDIKHVQKIDNSVKHAQSFTKSDTFSSIDAGEVDCWGRESSPNTAFSDYDTSVLSWKNRGTSNAEEWDDDEPADDYETVEYPDRDKSSPNISQPNTPPVPHNTPSRTLDADEGEDTYEEFPRSYEEVEFVPKDRRQTSTKCDTGVYGSHFDRMRSSTVQGGELKDKTEKEKRRFTGVQAHLQKIKDNTKAKMKKAKKGFMKHEEKHSALNTSFSDAESVDSYSSRRSSSDALYKSLEDVSAGTSVPPHSKPSRQQSEISSSGSFSKTAPVPKPRLNRNSPLARRKNGALTSTDGSESLYSTADDTYETLGEEAALVNKRERVKKLREFRNQKAVSVFIDSNNDAAAEPRGRTSSVTYKRESTLSIGTISNSEQTYSDIQDYMANRPSIPILPISPLTKKRTKSGWLWKHGGHEGRAPMRRRWVVFDGEEMIYYESDSKTEFSKGIIPVEVMNKINVPPNDSLVFHVQTKGGRIYIFQAESSDERTMWTNILMYSIMTFEENKSHQFKPGGKMYMPYKDGLLKMDGIRQKVYFAIKGEHAAYYKDDKGFYWAQPVARFQMKLASVKDVDKKKFQIVFPYRTFTFTADNEEDKKSWIDHSLEAIAEGLSDYQVLNEIWENESNKKCADCGKLFPDWASINLGIVICKHCAGVHRELGVHNSKVRSFKMDVKIWDPVMKRLFLDMGNERANKFWAHDLHSSDSITDMADKNQRAWLINSKYLKQLYALQRPEIGDQELLNQTLIDSVRTDNLELAYQLVFSGADVNCYTGKEHAKSPWLLAEHLKYNTMAEFLRQNGGTEMTSPEGHVPDRNQTIRKHDSITKSRVKPPVSMKDCLYKYGGDFKGTSEETKKKKPITTIISAVKPGDFQKRLCVLENNNLKYCDPEKPSIVKDYISCNELISVTVHAPEQAVKAGYKHCFELSRTSGRTYLFCADREDTRKKWTMGLLQAIVPPYIQNVMPCEEEYDRIGKIRMKGKNWSKTNSEWSTTWCRLRKKKLQYFHNEARTMETIDLRRLVQITVDQSQEISPNQSSTLNKEAIPVIMLVFREKSYYIHSTTRQDTESWMAALRRSDNDSGPTLNEQQLTSDGVPIVLEKCLTYVEQFGATMRGIYRLSGTHSKTTQLLNEFNQNARVNQMREGHLDVHDVANALKRWFKSLPGSLLTEDLHEQWIETAQIRPEHHQTKLEWYKHLIEKLPEINQKTLKELLRHLKIISSHSDENEMSVHNIAIVFGPTLLEPQGEQSGSETKYLGQTSQEIACIEDLLQYYDWLFDVTEMDREKDERMRQAQEKINMAKQQQNMLTTLDYDMMVPIYINRKEDKCANYKVNLTAGELVAKVCTAHGCPAEHWGIYEVISDGDAERPLHYSEHVLSVIKAWDMPSTNYLVAKNDYIRDKMRWFKQSSSHDVPIIMEGQLRHLEGKKKWSKVTATLGRSRENKVALSYVKTSNKSNTVSFDISEFKIFIGVDKKTKPPGSKKQGFTLLRAGESLQYFVAETEGESLRWISHVLLNVHPEGFTPPESVEGSPSRSLDDRMSDSSGHRSYGSISQQELGELVAKAADLKRTSSNESSGSARDRFQHSGETGSSSPGYYSSPQGHHSPHMSRAIPEIGPMTSLEDGMGMEGVYDMYRSHASTSVGEYSKPASLPLENQPRRPLSHYAISPGDTRAQRGGLGIQLRDELSNVLRKKNPSSDE